MYVCVGLFSVYAAHCSVLLLMQNQTTVYVYTHTSVNSWKTLIGVPEMHSCDYLDPLSLSAYPMVTYIHSRQFSYNIKFGCWTTINTQCFTQRVFHTKGGMPWEFQAQISPSNFTDNAVKLVTISLAHPKSIRSPLKNCDSVRHAVLTYMYMYIYTLIHFHTLITFAHTHTSNKCFFSENDTACFPLTVDKWPRFVISHGVFWKAFLNTWWKNLSAVLKWLHGVCQPQPAQPAQLWVGHISTDRA